MSETSAATLTDQERADAAAQFDDLAAVLPPEVLARAKDGFRHHFG